MIQTYSRFGFSAHAGTEINNSIVFLACSTHASVPESVVFPRSCTLNSIEVQGTHDDQSPTGENIVVYLSRDAAGQYPVTNVYTQPLIGGVSSSWGCRIDLGDIDIHFATGFSVADTIYACIKTSGTSGEDLSAATAQVRVNWRA